MTDVTRTKKNVSFTCSRTWGNMKTLMVHIAAEAEINSSGTGTLGAILGCLCGYGYECEDGLSRRSAMVKRMLIFINTWLQKSYSEEGCQLVSQIAAENHYSTVVTINFPLQVAGLSKSGLIKRSRFNFDTRRTSCSEWRPRYPRICCEAV